LLQPKRRSVRKRKRVAAKPVKRVRQRTLYIKEESDSVFNPSDKDVPDLTESERRHAMRALICQGSMRYSYDK
jgi:hypothetical protein